MNAGDIMTRSVVTVRPETSVTEAAELMLQHRVSGLPVIDADGAVVGVVTEGDLLRRAETGTQPQHASWLQLLISPGRLAEEFARAHAHTVGEVMTSEVVAVTGQDTLETVVNLMQRRSIKRVPVLESGRLIGVVSRADLLQAMLRNMPPPGTPAGADADIRARIQAEIEKQPWGPRASVDVRVTAGVVELSGAITDERERAALTILAENTAGVTAVRNRLVWVEPNSGLVIPAEKDRDRKI